ncbi:hypothetical protein TVAG_157780 [Trichomonas vaginalis G3]|uniref:Uncharacterized protein n=1 Tax=Trichomonas vaginalis (strain ATCC PRA-98 / G3) TaxID=412133 RepID=A2FBB3_TRIV3|nr:Man1-Src1p-C-terminal domain-containing protein [Trichomonas vaginalis G3]EAX97793.1 hypothetical protein TVAG_157780 [Trichomonas vaginalis G3]KAI5552731.1 Man1-Src1p-C-terminal domain-containing protein [Trichomonas vaginalis G3]|eukprot:XP_001310723.1 hypothetical protein [Trichomonas vaginalis G3]
MGLFRNDGYEDSQVTVGYLILRFIFLSSTFIFIIYILFNNNRTRFESPDRYFKGAVKCPENGYCYSGQLFCKNGFRRRGYKCEKDPNAIDVDDRIKKIIKYIRSHPDTHCEKSIIFNFEDFKDMLKDISNDLTDNFGAFRGMLYNATDIKINSRSEIYSTNPDQTLQCRIEKYIDENYSLVILFLINVILICFIILIYNRKKSINKSSATYADYIISKLSESKRAGIDVYRPAQEFRPTKDSPLYSHWDKVMNIVERDPRVYALDTTSGKKWKII